MEQCERTYYSNGKIMSEWYLVNGNFHREGAPAQIYYRDNGNVNYEFYYINNNLHREDGPAIIFYDMYGNINHKVFMLNGKQSFDEDIINNWKDFCKMQIFR